MIVPDRSYDGEVTLDTDPVVRPWWARVRDAVCTVLAIGVGIVLYLVVDLPRRALERARR
jgi:hypothetical protein